MTVCAGIKELWLIGFLINIVGWVMTGLNGRNDNLSPAMFIRSSIGQNTPVIKSGDLRVVAATDEVSACPGKRLVEAAC